VVRLVIYDLSEQNWWTAWAGVGIFHSGVEAFGVEWAYGGHEYDVSGIFATNPGDAPGPVTFRERIDIGPTNLTAQEVQDVVQEMGETYKGNAYHLLQRNCNTFSNELCKRLTGNEAPAWVNRLAGIATCVHCLLPPAWVPIQMSPPTMSPTAAAARDSEENHLLSSRIADDARHGGVEALNQH
jgi:hypothetical protein